MAHTSLFDHVKLLKLMAALDLPRPYAIGHWECLCRYVAMNYPDGDISRMAPSDIELVAEWRGAAGAYFGVLVQQRFIDATVPEGLLIRDACPSGTTYIMHDWLDWCPAYVKQKVRRILEAMVKNGEDLTDYQRQCAVVLHVDGVGTEPRSASADVPRSVLRGTDDNPAVPPPPPATVGPLYAMPPAADNGEQRPPTPDSDDHRLPPANTGHATPTSPNDVKKADPVNGGKQRRSPATVGSQRRSSAGNGRQCVPEGSRVGGGGGGESGAAPSPPAAGSEQIEGADSASGKSRSDCPDSAAAKGVRTTLPRQRVDAAWRKIERDTKSTLVDLLRMAMEPRISIMLAAAGIADTDFRRVVGRKLQREPDLFPVFVEAYVRCVDRGKRIKNPGAWLRTALDKNGIQL